MIHRSDGIVMGSWEQHSFFAMEGPLNPLPQPVKDTTDPNVLTNTGGLAKWGDDNQMPYKLRQLIDDCGELQSIIKQKATFAINRGVLPVQGEYNDKGEFVVTKVIDDEEIEDFLEESDIYNQCYAMLKDNYAFGNFCGRLLLDDTFKKIIRIKRDDVFEMRLEALGDKKRSEKLFLCSQWNLIKNVKDPKVLQFPLIDPVNMTESLNSLAEKESYQIAFVGREPDWGRKYYADPEWYASRDWVNINIGVPKMKAAMYTNNMRPKFVVYIHTDFWEKFVFPKSDDGNTRSLSIAEKQQLKDVFYDNVNKYLSGGENAYKSLFTEYFVDPNGEMVKYIMIESVQDKSIDGELLKDSSTSGSMIAFSMSFNPAINGGSLPSGPYTNSQGGSNVRESTLLQVMQAEPERQRLIRILNLVAKFNGWKKKYNGFKWVISSTIPTTLDTGGSSKPEITSVPQAK